MDRVEKNIPLALRFASEWPPHPRVGRDEIRSECCAGLISADSCYDPGEGTTYSTYAHAVMRGRIARYISERPYGPFRLPPAAMKTEAGREAARRIEHCEPIGRGMTDPVDYRARLSVPEHADLSMISEVIRRVLDQLPERLGQVIRLRFFEGLTMAQVAEQIGVTRQRVDQIEAKALEKLRFRLPDWT